MSPEVRESLAEQFDTVAAKAKANAAAMRKVSLDDPLAEDKIKAMASEVNTAACDLSCMASKASRLDEIMDEDSGPVRVTVQTGWGM